MLHNDHPLETPGEEISQVFDKVDGCINGHCFKLTLTVPGPPNSFSRPPGYSVGTLGLPGYVMETVYATPRIAVMKPAHISAPREEDMCV